MQERDVGGGAGAGRGSRRRVAAAGGGAAAAEEGGAKHTSPGIEGAQVGRGAPTGVVTVAEPAGSAAQRARSASPGEGGHGKNRVADAETKGHEAENNGAGRRGAPLEKRGEEGDSAGKAQPSARERQEKGGGVGVAVLDCVEKVVPEALLESVARALKESDGDELERAEEEGLVLEEGDEEGLPVVEADALLDSVCVVVGEGVAVGEVVGDGVADALEPRDAV